MSAVVDMVVNHKKLNCSFKLNSYLLWCYIVCQGWNVPKVYLFSCMIRQHPCGWVIEQPKRYRYIYIAFFFPSSPFLAAYSNQVMGNNNAQKLSSFSSLLCSSPLHHPTYLTLKLCLDNAFHHSLLFVEIQIFMYLLTNYL